MAAMETDRRRLPTAADGWLGVNWGPGFQQNAAM